MGEDLGKIPSYIKVLT